MTIMPSRCSLSPSLEHLPSHLTSTARPQIARRHTPPGLRLCEYIRDKGFPGQRMIFLPQVWWCGIFCFQAAT
jgi:hypothetical protein